MPVLEGFNIKKDTVPKINTLEKIVVIVSIILLQSQMANKNKKNFTLLWTFGKENHP